jgi:hypothetical protein
MFANQFFFNNKTHHNRLSLFKHFISLLIVRISGDAPDNEFR